MLRKTMVHPSKRKLIPAGMSFLFDLPVDLWLFRAIADGSYFCLDTTGRRCLFRYRPAVIIITTVESKRTESGSGVAINAAVSVPKSAGGAPDSKRVKA